MLSDGLIELRVVEIAGADVVTEIVNGGMLGENKGINLPGVSIKVPSLVLWGIGGTTDEMLFGPPGAAGTNLYRAFEARRTPSRSSTLSRF